MEEEYELKPGIEHIGHQIMGNILKLGKGLPQHYISGHGGENLVNNPYWPPELASRAGSLSQERYVTLLPLMLSVLRMIRDELSGLSSETAFMSLKRLSGKVFLLHQAKRYLKLNQ